VRFALPIIAMAALIALALTACQATPSRQSYDVTLNTPPIPADSPAETAAPGN